MILEMLEHSKPGIVIIAAEIAAKLLLAGRLNDPTLIAWLVLVYFDSSLTRLLSGRTSRMMTSTTMVQRRRRKKLVAPFECNRFVLALFYCTP
jgi:hypothetical protein